MGWSDCGLDSRGRHIGYQYQARCDHKGCHRRIDRGLAFACGNMHGETEYGCEGYFCHDHLHGVGEEHDYQLCAECRELMEQCERENDAYEKEHK